MLTTTMETYTGKLVDLSRPDPESIDIVDIAWHLSRQPRFVGATRGEHPYSVAQHSVLVLNRVRSTVPNASVNLLITSLMHDAHEAYMGDVSRPMGQLLDLKQPMQRLKDRLQYAIYKSLFNNWTMGGSPFEEDKSGEVRKADDWAVVYESHHLIHSRGDWFEQALGPLETLSEEFILRNMIVKTAAESNVSFLNHFRDLTS